MTSLLFFFLSVLVYSISGNDCPRTNRQPRVMCVDECRPSKGCSNSKYECLCDGDCGYSCVRKNLKCRVFRPRNGKTVGNSRSFNATVKFRCNDKYTLFGPLTRRCRGNGKWDGKRPRCKIACPDPGIPDFCRRSKKQSRIGFQVKTILDFYCYAGYKMKGSSRMECKSNGQWSSPVPVCEKRACGRAILPKYSEVARPRNWKNSRTHPYGKRLILRCKSGYRKLGFGIMRCEKSWKILTPNFRCLPISCGDPGIPKNGKKTGLAYTFKESVHYSCDNCYTLNGASYRNCLANGQWSDFLPSCIRVKCPDPGKIENGEVLIPSKPMYCNSFVNFKCSVGYNLKGVARRTCTNNGKWSDVLPKCEIVDCGNPGNPKHGQTFANKGFTYAQDVSFTCDDGYTMEGNAVATCQANGKWSTDLPICLEKCSDPRRNTNAVVSGRKFYHGEQVRFYCARRDYVLVPPQSATLTCEDGKWKGTIPSCKAPCGSLKRMRNGYIRSTGLKHGSRASFYCYFGYKLVGSSYSDCNNGKWSNPVPTCPAICGKITSLRNGLVFGKGNLEGDQLSFRCQQNYVLDGPQRLTCQFNRRWSGRKPTCKAPCRKVNDPAHGRITKQGVKHNEKVYFNCDADYVLGGNSVITCLDGRWSGRVPRCLAPCKRFSDNPFPNGYIKQNRFRHNETVIFGCKNPYVIDGLSTLRCVDGKWDKNEPFCGAPCNPLPSPLNGRIIQNGKRHKEETIFECNKGYKLVGLSHHLCNSGVWSSSGRPPTCKTLCRKITQLKNGRVVGSGFEHGDQLTFECLQRYALFGQRKITCQPNRRWSSAVPTCKAICRRITQLKNGIIVGRGYHEGQQLRFQCIKDYVLVGQQTISCQSNGRWSEREPVCKEPCGKIQGVLNGKITRQGFRHDEEVHFTCDVNYVLEGSKVLICSDGTWNKPVPRCLAPCKPFPQQPFQHGLVIKNGFRHDDTVRFSCTGIYVLKGSSTLRCNDGIWDKSRPSCEVRQCPNIIDLIDGKVEGKGFLPGDKRIFTCKKNFDLVGPKTITCLQTGQWNGSLPECKMKGTPISCGVVTGIKGGRAIRNETHHGGKVVFECLNANYTMKGKKGMRCISGKWNRNKPKCLAPCKDILPPSNGFIVSKNIRHNGFVRFKCNKGYILSGWFLLKCDDGSWNHSLPTCHRSHG